MHNVYTPSKPLRGFTLAQAAIIVVIVGVVCAVSYPFFNQPKVIHDARSCLWNVKETTLALAMYSTDFDDKFPGAKDWMDALRNYTKNDLINHDPALKNGSYGYAFRTRAAGIKCDVLADPAAFIVVFDSTLAGRNQTSELWSAPRPGRHAGNDSVGFADGHGRYFTTVPNDDSGRPALIDAFEADDRAGPRATFAHGGKR